MSGGRGEEEEGIVVSFWSSASKYMVLSGEG